MWVFITLVSFGFAFMLYALVQFCRESKRTKNTVWTGVASKVQTIQAGRSLTMISKYSRSRFSPRSAYR
jgi:hypothetical protein